MNHLSAAIGTVFSKQNSMICKKNPAFMAKNSDKLFIG
jgi:hypothetical protein